ncbi:filopodia upregulated, FAM65 domain-containing protein [Ditylenchus destructor]|nr:filopodia upregulated, FAM65 domain-containing protein [Ditylenchus destructor]
MRHVNNCDPKRFDQLYSPLLQGYLSYIDTCRIQISQFNEQIDPDTDRNVFAKESPPTDSLLPSQSNLFDAQKPTENNPELALLLDNYRLYTLYADRLLQLRDKHDKSYGNFNMKGKSERGFGSIGDLRSLRSSSALSQHQNKLSYLSTDRLNQIGVSSFPQLPKSTSLFASANRLFGRTDRHNQELEENGVIEKATMAAVEAEMTGMLGRLHVEVKAIVGFARITAGDVFEVVIKHGTQRWKSRGKTQPDKSQKWDQSTATFDCLGDAPVIIKVVEVRFFKSRCLNERSFDPIKFFSSQPQLVTMNLNSIGSMKLQLIVTWLPLLTSKSVSNSSTANRLMNGIQSASHLGRHQSKVSDVHRDNYSGSLHSSNSLPRSKSMGADPMRLNGSISGQESHASEDSTPPRICLREKKRERQTSTSTCGTDKDRWRSSTTILDSLYKDLSKSILTIDDLSVLSSSRNNLNKTSDDDKSSRRLKRNSSAKAESITISRQPSGQLLNEQSREKSASISHLAGDSPAKKSSTADANAPVTQKGVVRKTKLSSLKRNRNAATTISEKPPAPPTSGTVMSPGIPEKSPLDHRRHSSSQARLERVSQPNCPPTTSNYSPNKSDSVSAVKSADALLDLIDMLRMLLGKLRSAEYPELVGFEACMLNFEAVLKLNRAGMLESTRLSSIRRTASTSVRNAGGARSSLYVQHSPSTASDEMDENGGSHGTDSQASENDSGIDSLRQYISPYNTRNSVNSHSIPSTAYGTTNSSLIGSTKMAQRRFKQFKERRKSLGVVLDDPVDYSTEFERLTLNGHPSHNFGQTAIEKLPDNRLRSSTHPYVEQLPQVESQNKESASGSSEIDVCLRHHLERAINSLKTLYKYQGTPFEFTVTEMLYRTDQDTTALEIMLEIIDSLPNPPNVAECLAELGAASDLQKIWLSSCSATRSFVLVPTETVYQRMQAFLRPIVEARYPRLVEQVSQTIMNLICNGWDRSRVSMFQLCSLFRGKHLPSFVENISHEAWITSNLMSSQVNAIKEVMNRLHNVPVVPPLESLRHIGLVLARESQALSTPIEKYFQTVCAQLANDLSACYMCLLEHEDELSRCGACRALAILKQENALRHLEYLVRHDPSARVQSEAHCTLKEIRSYYSSYQEVTKI